MVNSDMQTTLLVSLNIVQMLAIMILVLPGINVVTLSKNIKIITNDGKKSPVALLVIFFYLLCITLYGILYPIKIFNDKTELNNASDRLKRLIDITNASRNYLLAGLSLFFVLVIIRLCDYIHFSAKLHEFSDLMGHYDLIDIAFTAEVDKDKDKETNTVESSKIEGEETEEEEEGSPHWPSTIDFTRSEHKRIRTFFKANPRKSIDDPGSLTNPSPDKDSPNQPPDHDSPSDQSRHKGSPTYLSPSKQSAEKGSPTDQTLEEANPTNQSPSKGTPTNLAPPNQSADKDSPTNQSREEASPSNQPPNKDSPNNLPPSNQSADKGSPPNSPNEGSPSNQSPK